MDLSIIIVSWNVKDKLRDNLRALFQSVGNFNYEVFVVDNDSHDGTAEMVKNEFNQVKLIANKENFGFAKANNQAIKIATGRYVLLLNPDMKVYNDTLIRMVEWMDRYPQSLVAGCQLENGDGETIKHVRRFPKVTDQLAIILKLPHFIPGILAGYIQSDFDYTSPAVVDSIRGSFFMIRKSAIEKVGALDERFFVWFEEVDYCRRVKEAGGQVWYTPVAKCLDLAGASFSQLPRGRAQSYFRDSMLKYFKKWKPTWQYWLLLLVWPIGNLSVFIGDKLKMKSKAKT